jgi:hypothetical protein
MKTPAKNPRVINTDAPVKNDGVPRLPNERDDAPDKQNTQPPEKMKQAYRDIENGQVDTDLRGERGVETVKGERSRITTPPERARNGKH